MRARRTYAEMQVREVEDIVRREDAMQVDPESARAWRLLFFVCCEDRDNLTGDALQRKAGAKYVAIAGKPHGSFFDVQDRGAQCHDWQHLGWVEVAKNSGDVIRRRESTLSCFRGMALLHPLPSLRTTTPAAMPLIGTTLWRGLRSMRRNAVTNAVRPLLTSLLPGICP